VTSNAAPNMPAWLEQAWLERYLDRQLDMAETAWFEAYALDKPELLAAIDADTRLRDALAGEGAAMKAPVAVLSEHIADAARRERTNAHYQLRGTRSLFAVAAAFVLGIGAGGIALRSFAPSRSEIIGSPTHIVFDTLRGEATPPRIEHADSTSPYVLIEAAVPPGAHDILLHIDGLPDQVLSASADGFASALLDRKTFSNRDTAKLSFVSGDAHREKQLRLKPTQ